MGSFIIASTTKKSEGESTAHGAECLENMVFYTGLLKQIQHYLQRF